MRDRGVGLLNQEPRPQVFLLNYPCTQDVTDTGAGMELAPSMDVFSAGCVLIELLTDSPPFNFSNLLAYRAGEYSPDRVLDKIEDPHMKVSEDSVQGGTA